MTLKVITYIFLFFVFLTACGDKVNEPEDSGFFSEYDTRNFMLGFTSWPYAPTVAAVDSTYGFIKNYADIYTEHFDYRIPWKAWFGDEALPAEFTNDLAGKVARRIPGKKLLLSVSLLNNSRNDLAYDYDGTTPLYEHLYDKKIEDAYYKHVIYLIEHLSPDYLVIVIEANLLWATAPEKWNDYKKLAANVTARVRRIYPSLPVSESMSLNSLYDAAKAGKDDIVNDMFNYMNNMDFASISFYPFMRNLHTKDEVQEVFDFLHQRINNTIAFVETSTIAEDLSVPGLNIYIKGNEIEQNDYLETLMLNAQRNNYEFIIWWAHRDFDALWEIFPDEVKDIGKIWRDTGILDENGNKRKAFFTWDLVYGKKYK